MKIMCHGKLALRQYLSWDRDPLTMYANSLLSKFLDNEKDLPFYLVQIQEHYYLHRSKSCGEGIHSSWVSNRHTQKGKGKKKNTIPRPASAGLLLDAAGLWNSNVRQMSDLLYSDKISTIRCTSRLHYYCKTTQYLIWEMEVATVDSCG